MANNIETGGLVTFTVKVNGSVIPETINIFSIQVEKAANGIPTAKIVVLDGDPSQGTFQVSSSSTFVPGNEITIETGYDLKNKLIFKGIITQQTLRIDETVGSTLEVVCRDKAIKMTVGRKSATFLKQKDSDILKSIIENYGLTSSVAATTSVWPEMVQYCATDWDFLVSRAEANGLLVLANNGKVTIQKPDADTSPVQSIMYGENLYAFHADLNALSQLRAVDANAWNYKNQELINGNAANSVSGPGNISSKKLSEVVGLKADKLQTSGYLSSEELTNWAKAELTKSEYSKIRGEAKIQGTSLVEPGKYISLKGLGDRFSGDHFISKVVHTLAEGNWFTEVSIGLSSNWFTEEKDVMAPSASGLLPGARGLFNGTVTKISEDPESQFRVLVDVPLLSSEGERIWARMSNFYASNGAGAFFMPEVGDEIILGFLSEDPRYPVILGSLYSSPKNKPDSQFSPDENNSLKGIVSKSGIRLQFDDENKVLAIETPAKNTFVLNDKDKQITVQDQNNNSIVMSEGGIVLKSAKDITVEADQNLILKGTRGVTIESSAGDVSISGTNIKESAQVEYSAKGSASASVQGGGELTLKGAMVMIN